MTDTVAISLLFTATAMHASEKAVGMWQEKVRPLLDANCVKCHGPLEQKSGLALDTMEGLLKGGDDGPAVTAGKPAESLLWKYLASESDPHMPPKKQLAPAEIEIIYRWISDLDDAAASAPAGPIAEASAAPAETSAAIDFLLETDWKAGGLTPAPVCDDRTFARRLWLDLAGRFPTHAEMEEFLFSPDPDKRTVLTDRLMASADYARNFREVWDVVLMGRSERRGERRRENGWHSYLEKAFAENRPWNVIVRDIIAARPGNPEQNGAQWFLFERKNDHQAMAEAIAPVIYGTQLNCAQCHDHPLAREIKQAHYWGLVAAFNRSKNVESGPPQVAESAIGGFIKFTNLKKESQPAVMTMLSGQIIAESPPAGEKEEDSADKYLAGDGKAKVPKFSRRMALAEAVTTNNPLLARAFVNRIWAQLLGRGIVHPVDEMNSRNPPSHPELLERLAADFSKSNYDIRRLVRAVVLSRAYQRTVWRSDHPPPPESFAAALEKPLIGEALARAMATALGRPGESEALSREMVSRFSDVMPRDYNASVQQAMFLTNSPIVAGMLKPSPGSAMERLLALPSPELRVRNAFLTFLGRLPDAVEESRSLEFLRARPGRNEAALAALTWAILTSPEFLLNQ